MVVITTSLEDVTLIKPSELRKKKWLQYHCINGRMFFDLFIKRYEKVNINKFCSLQKISTFSYKDSIKFIILTINVPFLVMWELITSLRMKLKKKNQEAKSQIVPQLGSHSGSRSWFSPYPYMENIQIKVKKNHIFSFISFIAFVLTEFLCSWHYSSPEYTPAILLDILNTWSIIFPTFTCLLSVVSSSFIPINHL